MTETLRQRIARHEGKKLKPYRDSLGKLTIGIGRCLDTKGISDEEAFYLLDNDIAEVKQQVAKALPWIQYMDDVRRDVLFEMAFQLGVNGLLAFKNTLAYTKAGDYVSASKNMLQSAWATQTPNRAEELAEIMKTGKA